MTEEFLPTLNSFPRKSLAKILATLPGQSVSNLWSRVEQGVLPRLKRRERLEGFIKKTVLPFPRLG